ncbi:MAG: lysophospholipase [Lachnospiraceae bacterium]|nr:lysophospholipase [Lachnospiraceae bacterium]
MKMEEFYFDSKDGTSKIHAVQYIPDTTSIVCVVQIVHGMAEYVERYEEFAQALTKRGIVVTGENHLGHGKTVGKDGTLGYFCEEDPATVLVEDVHTLRKQIQKQYPGVPYFIVGHSMGSFMVRNYLCRYGEGVSGAVLLGTGMHTKGSLRLGQFLVKVQKKLFGSKHVSILINWLAFGSNNQKFKPARTRMDWLSRDEKMVDEYVANPLCGFLFTINGFEALFELIFRLYDKQGLDRIPKKLPILLASGSQDPVGENGRAVKRSYDSLKNAGLEQVQMKLYEKSRHEILNDLDKEIVTKDICDWIMSTI